jgi:hypothetical protein
MIRMGAAWPRALAPVWLAAWSGVLRSRAVGRPGCANTAAADVSTGVLKEGPKPGILLAPGLMDPSVARTADGV